MGRRIVETGRDRGWIDSDLARVEGVHAAAVAVRREAGVGEHDGDYLHPGRSALVLLLDVDERDASVLGAAIAFDSEHPEWTLAGPIAADPELAQLVARIPPAGAEDLAERLVVADDRLRRAALAERLDHLRHAHLWTDAAARRRAHEEAVAVYAPVAERTHPMLARRFAWWCRMFGARHLG